MVDHKGVDHSSDPAMASATIEPGSPRTLVSQPVFRQESLLAMLKTAEGIAQPQADKQVRDAKRQAKRSLTAEIERLEDLARRNDHISPAELEHLGHMRDELITLISQSRLRLDSIRLIWRAPA